MGRILEYVVLLSNLSLILGGQQFKDPINYEREKQANFTPTIKQLHPRGQNEFLSKRILPLDYNTRRRLLSSNPKQMRKFVGLHAFATDDNRRSHRRNFSEPGFRNPNLPPRRSGPPFPHNSHQRKNSKTFGNFHGEIPSQKLSRLYTNINQNNQNNQNYQNSQNNQNNQNKKPDDISKRWHNEGRNQRYQPWRTGKVCDPCNSVPWVPILNVPDSYRQQRTHLHSVPQQHNFDYHGYASDTHNVLVPPVPLAPPAEPIYDGTISSSYGLPIGNIPTGHGLLAPLNNLASIDYSSAFNYYSPHGLLENHAFPELSPVPVVPIHDSGQFYQFDSSIPDLVPPPTKPVDVSKVVLTISEENSGKLEPPKPGAFPHNHKPAKDSSSASSGVASQAPHSSSTEKYQHKDLGNLEIVKSIPLAEFSSAVNVPKQQQQQLPLYPPLQSDFSNQKEFHTQKSTSHSNSNYNFLVPPLKTAANFSTGKSTPSYSKQGQATELQGEPSAPKPLTSPSLSWLFSDHTAPPGDSHSTASVLSFATETEEIAAVVNNGLRPVSPIPIASTPNVGNGKSKKIQIIIPYTTKNKNEHDNNALESVQHEVFQPPVSKSTSENNSLRDFATPALPPLTHQTDTTGDRKVIDEVENQFKDENQHDEEGSKSGKYLSEMHHIIASNIRELLREEIEKSQNDQNYPLQNNIDNWTALEYSNHKTVEAKAPKEIITQALAVTSIPGTSISHLLLPSKKIPNEYFVTTPIPVYDEPTSSVYKTTNSTVNSSPFTAKPYATTSVFNPTTRNLRENTIQNKENTPPVVQVNHESNYTEVGRGRVNNWGRLTENMVIPEARSRTRRIDETTTPSWSPGRFVTSGSEKVHIVTPVSLTSQRNYTTSAYRRTTRHVHRPETPTTEIPRRIYFPSRINSTRLEKVSNGTSPFNRRFIYNTTPSQNVSSSQSVVNTTTTTEATTITTTTTTTKTTTDIAVIVAESVVTGSPHNQTNDDIRFSEHLSINDVFPFRNKELPWQSNLNVSQTAPRQIGRQRKSLIKQVNLQRSRPVAGSS